VAQDEARAVRSGTRRILSLPPRVEVSVARRTYPGGQGADVGASLWQDLPLGGHAAARSGSADARVQLAEHESELARRAAIRRALDAWIDARLGREILAMRERGAEAATQLLRIATDRVEAGKDAPLERTLARAVLGAARASVLDAEGRIVEADASLRYALSLDPQARIEVSGDLRASDDRPIDEQRVIEAAEKQHPLVSIARGHADVLERNAEVAASNGRPVLGLGLTYAREATGDQIVGGAVSVPLPLVNPQSFEAATARADAAAVRMRTADVQLEVAREARLAIHEREHAREVRDALLVGAVEPGREALRELVARYESGAVALATVIAARRDLLAAEEAWMEAAADVHRADVRLEYAVGADLPRRSKP